MKARANVHPLLADANWNVDPMGVFGTLGHCHHSARSSHRSQRDVFCLPGRQAGTEVLTRTSVPAARSPLSHVERTCSGRLKVLLEQGGKGVKLAGEPDAQSRQRARDLK